LVGGVAIGIVIGCKLGYPELESYTGPESKIAFIESEYSEYNYKLWIVNPDGSGLEKLSDGLKPYGIISFSPNAKYITFKGKDDKHRIIDLEGRVLHEFEGGVRSGYDFAWTPEDNSILFGVYTDGIYRYNLEYSKLEKIFSTDGFVYDHNPVMSPNLEKIVFTRHAYGSDYYILLMDADGGNVELITSGTGYGDEHLNLNWLDNKNIIFKNLKEDKLYYFNTETKEGKEIDSGVRFLELQWPDYEWKHQIILSPDKKTLAILGAENTLYFINADELASGDINVHDTGLKATYMDWSPDGNYFVIGSLLESLETYDRDGNRYRFLEEEGLPEEFGAIRKHHFDWSGEI